MTASAVATNTVLDAALEKLRAGRTPLPVAADGSKRPAIPAWKHLQGTPPTEAVVRAWYAETPDAGLAKLTTAYEVTVDIDDPALADELVADIALQAEAPLERTPRGGLHIDLASSVPTSSGPLVTGDGVHVGDLKAAGGYIITAPTPGYSRINAVGTSLPVRDARAWVVETLAAFGVSIRDAGRRDGAESASGRSDGRGAIAEGTRNTRLASYAGTMQQRAMSPAAIEAALLAENAQRCDPPLPVHAVRAIAASIGRYPPGEPPVEAEASSPSDRSRAKTGGAFILDAPASVPALWGDGDDVLHAAGEALLIVGPDGVGKTTLAQRYVLARCGFASELLGYRVEAARDRVLYLALDRPPQIARSFRRMVSDAQREQLDERLVVWGGPLPVDVLADPLSLRRFVDGIGGISDVVIDSLKDVVVGLSEDKAGAAWNMARQDLLAAEIDMVEIHHQRKEQRGNAGGGKP
ncbi:MAG: AAA family ATPase, partial [Chloroflexi bacterium]|nr:AAA family ATPase [Chloroflexota bacterium]